MLQEVSARYGEKVSELAIGRGTVEMLMDRLMTLSLKGLAHIVDRPAFTGPRQLKSAFKRRERLIHPLHLDGNRPPLQRALIADRGNQ